MKLSCRNASYKPQPPNSGSGTEKGRMEATSQLVIWNRSARMRISSPRLCGNEDASCTLRRQTVSCHRQQCGAAYVGITMGLNIGQLGHVPRASHQAKKARTSRGVVGFSILAVKNSRKRLYPFAPVLAMRDVNSLPGR